MGADMVAKVAEVMVAEVMGVGARTRGVMERRKLLQHQRPDGRTTTQQHT